MAAKFYHTANAGRKIGGEFQFEVYNVFGGCPFGVYRADSEAEQTLLNGFMSEPRNALSEITEAEYESLLKKNSASQVSLPVASLPGIQALPVESVDGNYAINVEQPAQELPAAANAVTLGDVTPAELPKPNLRKRKSV